MELFSNLLWLALSSLLLVLWVLHRKRGSDESRHSSIGIQFIALALLIVILLPVVSLTDDLQACTLPAESEHLSRRSDFQTIPDFSQPAISVVVAGVIPFNSASPQTSAWLSLPLEKEAPFAGYLRILGTRPPPTA